METLYLKYRPRKFDELVWQNHAKKLFENALKKGAISHSYLFSGPRGTGKTSAARILAKSLNCTNPTDGYEPCNECQSCLTISSGRSMDVIEMDAASNRGIDEIRAIRDRVAYLPVESRYKVYIIDEVHMLTKEAFNALLKTLEEPPEHTIFILATTEMQRVPETVVSRCQVVEFRKIPSDAISGLLRKICDSEGVAYEPEALSHIARKASGGLRDALSLLEEIIRFSNDRITLDETLFVLGEVPVEMVENYVSSMLTGNTETLLSIVETIGNRGIDPTNFAEETLEFITDRMPDRSVTAIGKFVIDLIQRLRHEERQFDVFKILSVYEALKSKDSERSRSRVPEDIEPRKNDEIPETRSKNSHDGVKTDVERLIEFYAKEGDLSLFACLEQSEIKDFGDRILVISRFPIHHDIIRNRAEEMREDLKKLTSRDVGFVSAYSEVPTEKIDPKIREAVIKTLSVFGGKLLPEGGEEIG